MVPQSTLRLGIRQPSDTNATRVGVTVSTALLSYAMRLTFAAAKAERVLSLPFSGRCG